MASLPSWGGLLCRDVWTNCFNEQASSRTLWLKAFPCKPCNSLVVHMLLLTHEFIYTVICLPHSWYPQCDRSMFFTCSKLKMTPLFNLLRSVGPGRCLIVYWYYPVLQCHKQRCAFFPFQDFFVGATSLVLLQQWSHFLHVFHTQPSSRTFWLMA